MEPTDCYRELIRLAELAVAGDDSAMRESQAVIQREFPVQAIPILNEPVSVSTISVYVRRAILGHMTVRMQDGDAQAFADLESVYGDLLRGTAHAAFGSAGGACLGESPSDLVQSAYRRMLEYAQSGRLRNDPKRESLRGLHHIIVKRAMARKRRRADVDVLALAHRRASTASEYGDVGKVDYADFVERAIEQGERQLDNRAMQVLVSRLRNPGESLRAIAEDMGVPYHEVKNSWSRVIKPFLRKLGGD